VFGLLGLSVFIGFFGLHRSSPIVGGLTLGLMTLPTIILSTRSALKTVPYSLKEAALGLGASKMETIFHHTLPYAMPGIITGVIIGISQAIGETAPLIMIGMVAFVADLPSGINDVSTALPVQIYIWSNSPEQSFTQKVAGAIVILLGFLILMNLASAILRNHFEKKNKL
jgi:phosphate transport system permease protein